MKRYPNKREVKQVRLRDDGAVDHPLWIKTRGKQVKIYM